MKKTFSFQPYSVPDISPIYNSPIYQFANMTFRQHTNVEIRAVDPDPDWIRIQ
jgi:hypothetical protein